MYNLQFTIYNLQCIMTELTQKQMERQDLVDNAIFKLLQNLNPSGKEIDWDIDIIAEIRDSVKAWFEDNDIRTEEEFYPFIEN